MTRSSPLGSRTGATSTTPLVIYLPDGWRQAKLWVDALSYAQLGSTYAAPAVAAVNGITTLTEVGAPTGGTITLKVFANDPDAAAETGTIAFDASAATTKTALTSTNRFVAGDITAGGGALNAAAITLTWTGVYAVRVPKIVLGTNALTGGSGATVQVRTTTNPLANGGYGYIEANTQETWESDGYGNLDQFLYVATVSGTGTYRLTTYA